MRAVAIVAAALLGSLWALCIWLLWTAGRQSDGNERERREWEAASAALGVSSGGQTRSWEPSPDLAAAGGGGALDVVYLWVNGTEPAYLARYKRIRDGKTNERLRHTDSVTDNRIREAIRTAHRISVTHQHTHHTIV